MNISDLFEAPLSDYNVIGDFSSPAVRSDAFPHPKDKQLILKQEPRLRKLLLNSPYKFRVYFCNFTSEDMSRRFKQPYIKKQPEPWIQNENDWAYVREAWGGEYTADQIKKRFGLDISSDPKGMTALILSNGIDTNIHRLSPWMIIHKFVHGVENGALMFNGNISPEVKQAFKAYEKLCEPDKSVSDVASHYRGLIAQGTMGSARNNNIQQLEEISTEFLTQFFIKGQITLKTDEKLEAKLNKAAKRLFDVCVGRIFVEF